MHERKLTPNWDEGSWRVIQEQSDYVEFDWFARDLVGNLAALASFGTAPSPAAVRTSRTDFNAIMQFFSRLPAITAAVVDPLPSGQTDDWEDYARCGLFAYDNADINGGNPRYERIASPETPLRLARLALPEHLLSLLPMLPVVFADSRSIPFASVPA
jgi:hypothetical protein